MQFFEAVITAESNVTLTVPCFIGEDDACRMNRFYEAAAAELYRYGCSLTEKERHSRFLCRCTVESDDDGITTVFLRLMYAKHGEQTLRKTVVHRWKDGFPVRQQRLHSLFRKRSGSFK